MTPPETRYAKAVTSISPTRSLAKAPWFIDVPVLDQRMDDLRVLMDTSNITRAVIYGISEGGSLAMFYMQSPIPTVVVRWRSTDRLRGPTRRRRSYASLKYADTASYIGGSPPTFAVARGVSAMVGPLRANRREPCRRFPGYFAFRGRST
jgi:hypothetical protein